jgi:nucleoside-diphosphate-sugar epimerase
VLAYRQKFVGTLNIGTGVTTSTPEIATMLSRNFGVSTVIKHTHIEATTACIAIDNQQARDILGWQPTVLLQDGLQLLIKQLPEKRSAK